METVFAALSAFWDYLASVQPLPLAIAVCCHIGKTICTSRAWRTVLAAAYPQQRVGGASIYAAYIGGVGVNALLPGRAGDVVRLTMAHRAVKGASYTTLVGSSAVLAITDLACASLLLVWAGTRGILPQLDALPSLPSFDFAWMFRHDRIAEIVLLALVVGLIALAVWLRSHVADLREHMGQAFAILRTPWRFLRGVVLWQLADWGLRLATVWFMLEAFGIDQSLRNVLVVQATQSLATLLPISPGGVGTEQAFLVYTLRDQAPGAAILAFSVGMRATLTVVNVVLGFTAILLTLRTLRLSRISQPDTTAGTTT